MKKLLLIITLFITPLFAFASTIERVSVSDAGVEGNNLSLVPSALSDDGRFVVFDSLATNLVAGDTNAQDDVFVYDRTSNTIERVNVDNDGVQSDGWICDTEQSCMSLSADGRYVVFDSGATNLVVGDTNGMDDIFVYDRTLDTIERVSVDGAGTEGNGSSYNPSLSSGGRYVTFASDATNLVVGDTNLMVDVFVYDRTLDTIERVSVSSAGAEGDGGAFGLSISDDGRYVAFTSDATNLVVGDTNGTGDIFVYDRTLDTIERMSVSSAGIEGNGGTSGASISGDGRYVAFHSNATNLIVGDTNARNDVFVHDRTLDITERVSVSSVGLQGNEDSGTPSISSDGRYVTFQSSASSLVAGDTNLTTDIFVYDRTLDTIERVSVSSAGVEADAQSSFSFISRDGRYVAFSSVATNLVVGDTNLVEDIFVVDRAPTTTVTTTIVNDNGGTLTLDGVTTLLDGVTITDGTATTTVPTTHTVTQTGTSGYTTIFGGDCASDGTIVLEYGDTTTCTVTLDDIASTLTVTTTVTNDDGRGNATITDFPLYLDGITITSGVATTTPAGAHTLTYGMPSGTTYDVAWGGSCATNGTLTTALATTYACTLTANDSPSNSGGGSGGGSHTATPPPVAPPTPNTPLTSDERTKLIAELKTQVISLIQQLVTLLREQLSRM